MNWETIIGCLCMASFLLAVAAGLYRPRKFEDKWDES